MTLLLAYARERLTPRRLLPGVLLIVVAVLGGRGWAGATAFAIDAIVALALVVAFRIWDDVTDRERDRLKHPDRVVVRASSTTPLHAAAWVIALGALVLVGTARTPASAMAIGVYAGVLSASYALRGPRTAGPERVLLLKYAVFTLGLIGIPDGLTVRGCVAAGCAFAVACVYEWWHDEESPVFSLGGSR